MKKIIVNMLSSADKVAGQGVGSAYIEQVNLLKDGASDIFDIRINSMRDADIMHYHTIDPTNYMRMSTTNGINVAYVHFLPETLDGSIKLPNIAFKTFKKYVISFYNKADYLVVVNPIFIDELVKIGIDRKKIVYIPNYVSKESFYVKSAEEIREIKDKYGIEKNKFVVLGVGQVQTRKGVLDFIECAKKLPNVMFVWCGGFSFGKITDGYEQLNEVYNNPPENVKFLGIIPREEMNDIYNMADILFMPSYNELFPMSILEMVNLHKPLLLRNLELYEDILFKKYMMGENNQDFSQNIKLLKNNKEEYQKYSNYSKEISEYYSKENVLKIWTTFYQRILKERQEQEMSAK